MLIDTHCHIHDADYPLPVDDVLVRAHEAGVGKMICVGTDERSSADALKLAAAHDNLFAAIGVHPHETKEGWGEIASLASQHDKTMSLPVSNLAALPLSEGSAFPVGARQERKLDQLAPSGPEVSGMGGRGDEKASKLVAIGEIGLDYFYTHSSREMQIQALEEQLQVALDHHFPVIFHVREAFDDFWPIFDNFIGIRGELHSFTDNQANLEQGLKRGLYVGVNGISTFTKDEAQKELFAHIPLEKLLLETDAPFLTPTPKRGTVNEPAFVSYVARHHATIRGISPEEIAKATSTNASTLFAI